MKSSPHTEEIRTKGVLFQRRSGHAIQQLGNGRRARKRELSDGFAFAHLATDHLNVLLCRDHVDDAIGYARTSRELNKRPFNGHVRRQGRNTYFGKRKCRERRLRCRLDDRGAACGERCPNLPGDHRRREVPRCEDRSAMTIKHISHETAGRHLHDTYQTSSQVRTRTNTTCTHQQVA